MCLFDHEQRGSVFRNLVVVNVWMSFCVSIYLHRLLFYHVCTMDDSWDDSVIELDADGNEPYVPDVSMMFEATTVSESIILCIHFQEHMFLFSVGVSSRSH